MKWRGLGDVSLSMFQSVLHKTPLDAESASIYAAVHGYSILYLAHLNVESNFGTSGIATTGGHNPTGLRPRGGDGFMSFKTWTDAAKEWLSRVTSPTYAYKDTQTVEDYIHVYAPSSDGNNEVDYVAAIMSMYDRFKGSNTVTATYAYGNVAKPSMIEMICEKPYEGAGFDRVAPRKNVGTCNHRTEGHDTPQSVHNLFSTGGERATDALTDYCIGTDGTIGHLNDENGTRAGWANGGSDGLEGDGPNFVNTFGIVGINSRLTSIEHCGLGGDAISDPQFEASCKLNAWKFDTFKVAWDSFPVNQTYGIVTYMEHYEFATKGCPGVVFIDRTEEMQQEIRSILKAGQTKAPTTGPVKPPTPVEVDHAVKYPLGMTAAKAEKMFGVLLKHGMDGKITKHGYDEKGAVSLAWLTRGGKEKVFPAADTWFTMIDSEKITRDLIVFKNGWTLYRTSDRSGWRWL